MMNCKSFWNGFHHSPRNCSQSPFWFLNGEVNEATYVEQMNKMAENAKKQGKNKLQILCCNLISNEYSWDPLGTRGTGERLASGLLGPVTLWKEGTIHEN